MTRGWPVLLLVLLLAYCSRDSFTATMWPGSPAPWEGVDGFFYPDRGNLTEHQSQYGLSSIDACRTWALSRAATIGDPTLRRSDYECGVGKTGSFGSVGVYRLTVR